MFYAVVHIEVKPSVSALLKGTSAVAVEEDQSFFSPFISQPTIIFHSSSSVGPFDDHSSPLKLLFPSLISVPLCFSLSTPSFFFSLPPHDYIKKGCSCACFCIKPRLLAHGHLCKRQKWVKKQTLLNASTELMLYNLELYNSIAVVIRSLFLRVSDVCHSLFLLKT